jgi:hypothetical protein
MPQATTSVDNIGVGRYIDKEWVDDSDDHVLIAMEYKAATTSNTQAEEGVRTRVLQGESTSIVFWVDLSTEEGLHALLRLVPSIEHRMQLLQHVTVYGLRHAMWVIGNPSGVPYRVVHVKYPDALTAAWLGFIKQYMEKVCPFGDPESPPPTIDMINTALGETEVTKHARSIAVVLQNVDVRRNLLRVSARYYTTTELPLSQSLSRITTIRMHNAHPRSSSPTSHANRVSVMVRSIVQKESSSLTSRQLLYGTKAKAEMMRILKKCKLSSMPIAKTSLWCNCQSVWSRLRLPV